MTSDRDFLSLRVSPALVESVAWGATLVAILCAVADVVFGPWDHDGGFYLIRGAEVAAGLKPYLDVGSIYPPLMEVLTALMLKSGISRIALAVLIPIGWVLANMTVTAFLAYAATRDRGLSVLAGSLFVLFSVDNGGNHLTLEHGVAFFGCLAFVPLVREGALTPRRVATAALFASAAAMIKQNGIIVYLPIFAACIAHRGELTRRHVIAFFAGALAVPLGLLLWLEGNAVAIYRNVVSKLGVYAEMSEPNTFGLLHEWHRSPQTIGFFLVTLVLGVLAFLKMPRHRLIVLAAAAGAVIQFLPRYIRDYPHYNINMWPFLALILVLGLAQVQPEWRTITAVFIVLFALFGFMSLILSSRWSRVSPLLTVFHASAQIISAVTPDDALVRQYGSEPIIEFLAYRRQEAVNKPMSTLRVWDGSGMYSTPPARSTTVVILSGSAWVPQVMRDLDQLGFALLARVPSRPPVLIYRHRSTLARNASPERPASPLR